MKKAFDQTFRDIKRGVNKKVLKVPSIEQKVLDATSNEPWGPHGTHLADIAQASRNYHEYQMIMTVVWKRLNDSGKNWRHVFKGLTVLEYLVVNGSERVIEDIREHAYQITALSNFQYIDSTGRDQGSNVRKKSQMLVALVNDKEKIQEAREKAAASRDKFRTTAGGPGGDERYEGRYGSREEDRNGYGREKEWGDEKYYKDDESRGRSTSNDGDYGPRSQSSDREGERSFEDDGHRSSRGSNARVEDASPDASRLEPKLSGQSSGAPPSYEDAVTDFDTKRDGETATAYTSKPSSPQATINHQETPAPAPPPPAAATPPPPAATTNIESDGFDFFDPRGATPAAAPAPAPPLSGSAEMDLFGSLSDSFSSNALALVPSTSVTTETQAPTNSNPYLTFDTASPASGISTQQQQQPFDDPFGDGPFRAVPSTDGFSATSPFTTSADEQPSLTSSSGFEFVDILADILPPSGPPQTAFQPQPGPPSSHSVFPSQNGQPPAEPNHTTFPTPFDQPPSFPSQGGQPVTQSAFQLPGGQQSMPQHLQNGHQSAFQLPSGQQPAFQVPGGHQSMPQSALNVQNGHQSMPQSALQVPSGQQPMPQSAFQVPGGQQPMPQSAFQAPGGHQSMPQSALNVQNGHQSALQVPGGQQPMPQSALQVPGGPQSMPQPAFQAPVGQQPMPQSAFQAPGGQQFMPQSALHLQNGHQSMPQSAFQVPSGQQPMPQPAVQVQGGHQSIPQPNFPAQGNQSMMQPGFAPQASQNAALGGLSSLSVSQPGLPTSNGQSQSLLQPGFPPAQGSQSQLQPGFLTQAGQTASVGGFPSNGHLAQPGFTNSNGQPNNPYASFQPQNSSAPVPQVTPQYNPSNFYQHQQQPPPLTASSGALALVPQQATDKKFETKSTVWTDTLNRGLVNLNISGSKTNPLSDIGIDFDAINRKEKRMEKPSKTPVTSNVTMGKAMGSGSGIGRAGAGAIRPAPGPGPGPGMGAPGPAGYGALNQPMGMNHNHNHMPQNMGIGMNMGQGFQMQQPGFPQPGSYNPMMGRGAGYGHQPYGGYR